MKWTPKQEQAILESGKDILVSAAAGSGKTAVLVERVIHKITNEKHPINIDELLVVTFTNAAAQEMRTRVGLALEKAIAENPASTHIKKQLSLLQQASITTLHSFCMEVVRKYSYLLEIDPAFRIADEMEMDLIKQEVIDELFEEWYGAEAKQQERFYQVVDTFSSDRSDVALEDLILRLHTFSVQHPWPDHWLRALVETYHDSDPSGESDLNWLQILKEEVANELEAIEQELMYARKRALIPDGPYHYVDTIDEDHQLVIEAKEQLSSWENLQTVLATKSFKRLSSKRVDCDPDIRKEVQDIRNGYRKRWNEMKDRWFRRELTDHLKDLQRLAPRIETLISLVKDFSLAYETAKREKAIVDFADLEHFCLQLLMDGFVESAEPKPSTVAVDFQNEFKEILIDEYQDTNVVQETILQLIREPTKEGNLFMVGDVKQSIYRFRHAEPSLFIQKYNDFVQEEHPSVRIDLAKNFRSREVILQGVNFLFKQILDQELGEVDYDENAQLVFGNQMFTETASESFHPELLLIDRENRKDEIDNNHPDEDYRHVEAAQLEARAYAMKIKQWIGQLGEPPLQIIDDVTGKQRNVEYRDIVILQRSMTWASVIVDEFKKQNIPVYAELTTGYFAAIEIQVMLSFLKIIDNPRQDIPFVAVLRSPILQLNEEELAKIRTTDASAVFYDAFCQYIEENNDLLANRLEEFHKQLNEFRQLAREGALSELIWQIYRETGYYDFVGGIPGGRQRQANLRALYDRARFYETTSFRGLFRFLRFIERMEERGDDLGAARALSEQEDVVRLTTIHRSKGLEFPVVIVGGINRPFNLRDLSAKYLLDKDVGFATKFIDPVKRITYPTLYYYALQKKQLREQLSEELRILYVALTRAKEKLVMVGNVPSVEKELDKWNRLRSHDEWLLPAYARADARSYLQWVGPALMRHRDFPEAFSETIFSPVQRKELYEDVSRWKLSVVHGSELMNWEQTEDVREDLYYENIKDWEPLALDQDALTTEVEAKLSYHYPYLQATESRAKQSVTELKRQREIADEYSSTEIIQPFSQPIFNRPKFMQEKEKLTASEYGTIIHTVMQHLPMEKSLDKQEIDAYIQHLISQEILTTEEAKEIDHLMIEKFYESEIAQIMMEKDRIYRELPFSFSLPAGDVYPNKPQLQDEKVLIQGVIDCLIPDEDGWILLDYKTDVIHETVVTDKTKQKLVDRYETQINLYRQAVEAIWSETIHKTYLYFFSKQLLLEVPSQPEE